MAKITMQDVLDFINEYNINNSATLISEEYINIKTPLKFKCNICGEYYERTFSALKSSKIFGCARCSYKNHRWTIEDVKKFLEENGEDSSCLLSETYKTKKTPLKFKCSNCEKEFYRSYDILKSIKYKTKCKNCSVRPYETEKVQEIIKKDGYELLEEYEFAHKRVKCKCSKGHIFGFKLADYLYANVGCPECSYLNRLGQNSIFWKGGMTTLKKELRSSKEVMEWKIQHFKDSNYKCDITGTSKDLEVHHLNYSFYDILKDALNNLGLETKPHLEDYDIEESFALRAEVKKLHEQAQGVVLNSKIHSLFHKTYGYYNNTIEQYSEFKEKYYKGEFL